MSLTIFLSLLLVAVTQPAPLADPAPTTAPVQIEDPDVAWQIFISLSPEQQAAVLAIGKVMLYDMGNGKCVYISAYHYPQAMELHPPGHFECDLSANATSAHIPGSGPRPGNIPNPMPGELPGNGSSPAQLPGSGPRPGNIPGSDPMPGELPGNVSTPAQLPGSGPRPGNLPGSAIATGLIKSEIPFFDY